MVEHEPNIQVMRFQGRWMDLGTWNTLTEAMKERVIGKGVMNEACEGVNIINETDVPVLAMGLHDVVISASPNGILVSDKEQSSYIKPFVDAMDNRVAPGDVITMAAGCRHTVMALTELKLMEVQLGKDISVDDKQKFVLERDAYEG